MFFLICYFYINFRKNLVIILAKKLSRNMNSCKICSSFATKVEDKEKLLDYYRCSSCGFISLDDTHRVDTKREKYQYDQHNNSLENEGYVAMFEEFIELSFAPYLEKIKTALDFGSGPTPVFSELLKRRGLEVDIYDIFYAPKRVYEDKSYDLITSTEVFEHLSKPLEVFELLSQHLNPNGYIALMTKFPPLDDNEFLNWWYRRDATHISFFTPKSFEIMAKKEGLELLKTINGNIALFQKKG